jgi:hypothetical protein
LYLEAFDDARNDLVLEAGVFTLGVLSNYNNIHILMASRKAREIEAIDKRSVKVELFSELNIERADSTTHRSLKPTFETHLVLLDRLDDFLRDPAQVPVHFVPLKEHRRVHRFHHLLHRVCYEWTHSVSRD